MLVLASQSPRRREMFDRLGLDYIAVSSDADEVIKDTVTPEEYVKILAKRKAEAIIKASAGEGLCKSFLGEGIYSPSRDDYIIAADTVVALDGEIFGKPRDREDAYRMIASFSKREHFVYSGFAILHGEKLYSESVATRVVFRELSEGEIYYYIDKEKPYDKAGAYGIQEMAGVFISKIEGNFDNVVGLPLCDLELAMKREFSVSLFDFEKPNKALL